MQRLSGDYEAHEPSLRFVPFSVNAASLNMSTKLNSNLSTPTSGVPSTDPNHATGLYNTRSNKLSAMASDLIAFASLDLYLENGSILVLDGSTVGTEVLNKIGFQNITLQKWINSQRTNVKVWSTYQNNSSSYNYEYSTNVTSGYNYRFVATHYAEKDWLIFPTIQTYYHETSYLYVS